MFESWGKLLEVFKEIGFQLNYDKKASQLEYENIELTFNVKF